MKTCYEMLLNVTQCCIEFKNLLCYSNNQINSIRIVDLLSTDFFGAFFMRERGWTMTIFCPRCHRAVMHHDGKSTGVIECKCRKCNKLIVFNPENYKIVVKEVPERTTGSGMRFY